MKAVNLYYLSRMQNMSLYGKYYASLCNEKERSYKPHEAKSLTALVDYCINNGATVKEFENFYYGYVIPQIGKEFDILKVGENAVLNIELKSWIKDEKQVLEQLLKNKFYLAHLAKKHYYFTFNSHDNTLYKMDESNRLVVCDIKELIQVNKGISGAIGGLIDDLFEVSQFIVSPIYDTKRFLNGEYFLTQQQQQIKRGVLQRLTEQKCVKIVGSAGTGKTLLLYDLALALCKEYKVLVLCASSVLDSQKLITNKYPNLSFCSNLKELNDLNNYDYLIVDECHRYTDKQFNEIFATLKRALNVKGIFAFEKCDVLLPGEKSLISTKLSKIRGQSFVLSGRIRINREINAFIRALFDKKVPICKFDYCAVEILHSENPLQTNTILSLKSEKGFTIVCDNPNRYTGWQINSLTVNDAHGKEFDNLSVVIDSRYFYTQKGKLFNKNKNKFAEGLYFAITRVRKNLCLVIEDNQQILARALNVKVNKNK